MPPGSCRAALERAGLADRADDDVSSVLARHAPAAGARARAAAPAAAGPARRAVHRPRRSRRRRSCRAAARSSPPAGASCCSRPTISIWRTAWSRASALIRGRAAGRRRTGDVPGLRQRAIARCVGRRVMGMFLKIRAARAAEGLRDRAEEPRDRLHDAVLRACRASWSSRSRSSKEGQPLAGRRRGHPVDCDRVLPARSRSAGRSSASGTARRCGRCCSRRRRGRRSTSASCSASCRCSSPPRLLLVPLVALLFQRRLLAQLPLLAAAAASAARSGSPLSARCSPRCWCARARASLLPILLYPITVPVMIAGVRGTAALLQAPPDEPSWRSCGLRSWHRFDVVFVTLALWTFEPLMTE